MKYEQDITRVLYEAGNDGLSVKKIARHIFNIHNGLFEQTPYEEVYKDVIAYINKNSKSRNDILEKTGKWGHYRLNPNSQADCQLLFNFEEHDTDNNLDKLENKQVDNSLSLF